jgi:hypothetical protein
MPQKPEKLSSNEMVYLGTVRVLRIEVDPVEEKLITVK